MIEFAISQEFPVSPNVIYCAWLNSQEHTKMTGAEAKCSQVVGGEFSAWNGYISGKNIELEYGRRIIQHWRTAQFSANALDSTIEITIEETKAGCILKLYHKGIPEGQPDYKTGWRDHYFIPMKTYFSQ